MKFLSKYEKIQVIAESGARHATQTASQMESDSERSFTMIYSREVEEMCPVAQGVHHGAAPIPEEAKWVQAKEVKDISGLTHGVGWLQPAGCPVRNS